MEKKVGVGNREFGKGGGVCFFRPDWSFPLSLFVSLFWPKAEGVQSKRKKKEKGVQQMEMQTGEIQSPPRKAISVCSLISAPILSPFFVGRETQLEGFFNWTTKAGFAA